MKHLVLAGVYTAAVVFLGCQTVTLGARATGSAALKLGYYGVAETAFKIATARNPRDLRSRAGLAQAQAFAGDEIDAFGTAYHVLIVRSDA